MKRNILLLLIALVLCVPMGRAIERYEAEIADVKANLAAAKSAKDSIKYLYDLFDLSNRPQQHKIAWQLLDVADRSGDYVTQLDILRQLTSFTRKDSVYKLLLNRVSKLPDSREKKETELFLKMRRVSSSAYNPSDSIKHRLMAEIITEEDRDTLVDKYDRVLRVYTLCEYLGQIARGDLMNEYMGTLERVFKEADFKLYALKNLMLTSSANMYAVIGERQKSLDADRKLLEVIDNLEELYKNRGRKYRNYNVQRFIVYRRMLSNYPALTLEEVDDLYDKVMHLKEIDEDVAASMDPMPRSQIYHLMAHGRYDEALPFVKKMLDAKNISFAMRRNTLDMLRTIARKTNNSDVMLDATLEYNKLLEQINTINAHNLYNELRVRFDVSELKSENDKLEIEKRDGELEAMKSINTMIIAGWILFAILVALALFFYARYRRLSSSHRQLIYKLEEERQNLLDMAMEEYTEQMHAAKGHSPGSNVHKVRHKNINMASVMEYLLNDMLYVAAITGRKLTRYLRETTAGSLMRGVVRNAGPHMPSDIRFKVDYPTEDVKMIIDVERAESIMTHILRNIVVQSHNCEIRFSCRLLEDGRNVKFTYHADGKDVTTDGNLVFDRFISIEQLAYMDDPGMCVLRQAQFLARCVLKMRKTPTGIKVSLVIATDARNAYDLR